MATTQSVFAISDLLQPITNSKDTFAHATPLIPSKTHLFVANLILLKTQTALVAPVIQAI